MSNKRFRIAFSFAGEKRDFVAQVAAILAARFGEEHILYDKNFEAKFARSDLGIELPELYHKESDLVVLVICKDYENKEWCGLEWTAIHALIKERRVEDVMLCRFDKALIKGLYSTAGFVELEDKTAEQFATRILERLADNEGHPKNHYTKPDPSSQPVFKTSIPNNLPRLQPFFGREKELAAIRDALDPESRTWGALIDGPGGMGKTSLAVRAAYDCQPGQFQRIVFVSIKDREMEDDGVRHFGNLIIPGLLEMLNELARELGQPEITKSAEDQRIRLLLEALRPTQTLLILDNLETLKKEDRDQLFTFVKRLPQGCKAILTSRRRIGSGSELLILEKLDETAALETLADLALHNPLLAKTSEAERLTLYTQTGGKPLLLRWVAGQLGRGSCRTFTDALHFLRSCPPDNDPLEFIFGDLVQEFTDDETKVLCAMTYFSLETKVEHITELAALEKESVEIALRTLANRSLVVPDREETSFTLVPMVADFLRRKRSEVISETGNRLEKRAYALIVENGYYEHDRFQVLDAAWPTVAPALPLFVAGPHQQLQTVCSALHQFLNFTGRWDELLSFAQQAEARAVVTGDSDMAGWRAYMVGRVHRSRQQADEVLASADRVAAHWQTANAHARKRAIAISLRGVGNQLKKDYPAAIAAFQEALDLHRSLSIESEDVAIAWNSLAESKRYSGDSIAAERDYCEALRVARSVSYAEGIATYTGNLAALALDRKDWAAAEALAREALPLSEKVGRQELIALDGYYLAKALVRQGKPAEALPYAQRALEILTWLGSPMLEKARKTLQECESDLSCVAKESES